jgi:leucyl aminopeptidase
MGNDKNPEDMHAFIGKGIVFDAGGLNIKPTGSMEDMHLDKSGACAVLAAIKQIAEMKLKINVTCTMAFAENSLSNVSYRPSDIIRSRKGLTVEIGNTDAEGRLVLADAMTWTQ